MSQPKLLIVDDEAGVRESLKMVFDKDFRILEADSFEAAVRKSREERPEVILLDIVMPGSSGLDTLTRIKEVHPDSQVIMLTALTTETTALAAKKSGAFDYIIKPFDVEEIRLKAEKALEKAGKKCGRKKK